MKIAGLQWIHYRRVSSGSFTPALFTRSCKQLTVLSHSLLPINEQRQRRREKEKTARQIERMSDEMREKASTVADLIYSITQQVSLSLPNSLNHGIWIDAVN